MSHLDKTFRNWVVTYLLERGKIDEIDAKILDELIFDSRKSVTDIANKLPVSRTTITDRLEKMMNKRIIHRFTTELNYNECGLPVTAYILVGYDSSKEDEQSSQKKVAKTISELKFVNKVSIITGTHTFLVEIKIDHMNSLADVIIEQMRSIKGVGNSVTMVSFGQYRNGKKIDIPSNF